MRKVILVLAAGLIANCAIAQTKISLNYLSNKLPENLELDKSVNRSYRMITDYYEMEDALTDVKIESQPNIIIRL